MMGRFSLIFGILAACLLAFSCEKEHGSAGSDTGDALVSVRFASAQAVTRASDLEQTEGETRVNTLDVLVYRADGTGALDVHHEATQSEIDSHVIEMKSPVGLKSIYLVANATAGARAAFASEETLSSYILSLSDNNRQSFVMIGTPGQNVSLRSGAGNDFSIQMRRIAARVSVRSIVAEFTSPAQRAADFRIKRIILGYVDRTAPLCYGDVVDPFGQKVGKDDLDGRKEGYYYWPYPESDEGFVNPAVLSDGRLVVTDDKQEHNLTVHSFEGTEGLLYAPDTDNLPHRWDGRVLLYMYPNSSPVLSGENDRTTKLIIETEWNGTTYWYPFSIPDVQPNTAYTFSRITLCRLGNLDPDEPLDVTQAMFELEVVDWENGSILGSYNGRGGYVINGQ
ncbi:MAG: hypothetical protein J6N54_00835 [Bacteroidales bacterium]|nr:hypothetical protein [Bacteroidales bacterium]